MKLKIPELNIKNFLIIAAVAGIGGLIFFVGVAKYSTTDPRFCLTCHAKGDTLDISVLSQVHPSFKKVTCVDCHAAPESMLMHTVANGYKGGYSAEPERVSQNCVRCHEQVTKSGVTEFKFNVMQIKIPHGKHLEQGILCTQCHSNITHDKGRQKTNRPKMENCMKCHDHDVADCYTCHTEGTLELPRGERVIFEESCTDCHKNFRAKEITVYDLNFSHNIHLDQNIMCNSCHSNAVKHGEIIALDECMECHGIRANHKDPSWATGHSDPGTNKSKTCYKCHTTASCTDCHKQKMSQTSDAASG